MKNLKLTTGGHKFFLGDLAHLMDAINEVQDAIVKGMLMGADDAYTGGKLNYYLSDVALSDTTVAGHITIPAGYAVFKGEICAFGAQNIAIPGGVTNWIPYLKWEEDITYSYSDPVLYADATSHNPHEVKKIKLAFSGSPVDDEDLAYAFVRISFWIPFILNGRSGVNLTNASGWTGALAANNTRLFRCYLQGKVTGNLVANTPKKVTTLAANIRPPADVHCAVLVYKSNTVYPAHLKIEESTGDVYVTVNSTDTDVTLSLEGVNYFYQSMIA